MVLVLTSYMPPIRHLSKSKLSFFLFITSYDKSFCLKLILLLNWPLFNVQEHNANFDSYSYRHKSLLNIQIIVNSIKEIYNNEQILK